MPLTQRLFLLLAFLFAMPAFAEETKPDVKSYMRVVDVDDTTLRLDMAFRVFAPADGKGPTIILGGAIHIADESFYELAQVGSSRVDLQACKLEYSIVSPK